MPEKILVVGHRNPDNDAVCAAVGFAAYCNAVDEKIAKEKGEEFAPQFEAVVLGPLPPESAWVLERNGFEAPRLVESIAPGAKVALVDHNEYQQSIPGIEDAEIVAVVDHHRMGPMTTPNPILMLIHPVGSTSTIIAGEFERAGLEITPEMAAMMMSSIITDTVMLRSPTTTQTDKETIEKLAKIAGVDAQEYAMEIFKCRGGEAKMDIHELVCADSKEFEVAGKTVLVAQRETVDLECVMNREDEMRGHMQSLVKDKGYNFVLLLVTDIIAEGSQFLCEGDTTVVEEVFGIKCVPGGTWMPGVLSRKKQVAAPLLSAK